VADVLQSSTAQGDYSYSTPTSGSFVLSGHLSGGTDFTVGS
jgi:hypothetical protein